jgi:hypothetical protein
MTTDKIQEKKQWLNNNAWYELDGEWHTQFTRWGICFRAACEIQEIRDRQKQMKIKRPTIEYVKDILSIIVLSPYLIVILILGLIALAWDRVNNMRQQ